MENYLTNYSYMLNLFHNCRTIVNIHVTKTVMYIDIFHPSISSWNTKLLIIKMIGSESRGQEEAACTSVFMPTVSYLHGRSV